MSAPRGRSGRRPGRADTREAILRSATRAFAEKGYDGATVRAIAADAGVDPAMIAHWFGSKEQLFMATVDSPIDPAQVVGEVMDGPADELGVRLVSALLRIWDSPAGGAALALVRSAVRHDLSARLLREFVSTRLFGPVAARLEPDPDLARWRTGLVATQMAGLIVARYVIGLEPIASAPHAAIVAEVAPTVQRYLTGPVGMPGAGKGGAP